MIYSLGEVQAFNLPQQLFKLPYITVQERLSRNHIRAGELGAGARTEVQGSGTGGFPWKLYSVLLVKGSKDASRLIENWGKQRAAQKSFRS